MPTQYGCLLRTPVRIRDAALLAGLQGRSAAALAAFVRRCNEGRSLDEQIPAPPLPLSPVGERGRGEGGAGYHDHDPRLLARLWAMAGIFPALQALAQVSSLAVPASPAYPELGDGLLHRLWKLARDGAALEELLRRCDRPAEIELLRLYTRNRARGKRPAPRIAEPSLRAGYPQYPRVLLALLWALVGNRQALRALGEKLQLAVPEPPSYAEMPDDLLRHLWKLGRDGSALETLWLRQGVLPVSRVGPQTPEAVLGFLAWHEQRADARDELLRRYQLLDATREEFLQRFKRRRAPWPYDSVDDFAQDVTLNLLQQVESWDYDGYPRLEHRLFRSVRNLVIDRMRQGARRPAALDLSRIDAWPVENETPSSALPPDTLPGLAHRVVLKARHGCDLTAEELDWSAGRNLEARRVRNPSPEQLAEERERISVWLCENPGPTGRQMVECFRWHDPCKLDRALRDWRLRQAADETRRQLDLLLTHAGGEAATLAAQVEDAMAFLVKRITGGRRCRDGRTAVGTVPLFAAMQETADRLWHRVGQRPLDHRQADDFGAARQGYAGFCEQFPILLRLAACWRLARWLIGACPAPAVSTLGRLAGWLEGGQWLATFRERDRQRSRAFVQEFDAARQDLAAGRCRSGLEMLLLWLKSNEQTGLPETRLIDLDRAWWLSRGSPAADQLAAHALAGSWPRVGAIAGQMLQNQGDPGRIIWSAERECHDCLQRLAQGQAGTLVKLASCRRLVGYLRTSAAAGLNGSLDQIEALLEEGRWQGIVERVQQLASPDGQVAGGGLSALRLLGLWLRSLPEPGLPGQAVQDLDRVWSLSHEPGYSGPAGLPSEADVLVAAAWQGDWREVARAAGRMAGRCPPGAAGAWAGQHEVRLCLLRLAERRERRR